MGRLGFTYIGLDRGYTNRYTLYTTQRIMNEHRNKVERKLKVVHARVSEALEKELKRRAGHLGVSVSNLVRNILKDTVGFVEEMKRTRTPGQGRGKGTPNILAWQEAVLNLNAVCEQCNALLPRGSKAALGITSGPGPQPVLCADCLATVTGAGNANERSTLPG